MLAGLVFVIPCLPSWGAPCRAMPLPPVNLLMMLQFAPSMYCNNDFSMTADSSLQQSQRLGTASLRTSLLPCWWVNTTMTRRKKHHLSVAYIVVIAFATRFMKPGRSQCQCHNLLMCCTSSHCISLPPTFILKCTESSPTHTRHSQIQSQIRRMQLPKTLTYSKFDRDFDFDSHDWGCSE